ncbi:uncharacterized protein METZ01_LOCUS186305, partial [marine metagenome]
KIECYLGHLLIMINCRLLRVYIL